MDRDRAREQIKGYLRSYVESITQKSRGANMFNCPLCGSGSGTHGTGAFSVKDGTSWKCFSCGEGGDIFDLIGKVENLPDYNDQLRRAGELFGIAIDRYASSAREDFSPTETEYQKWYKNEQYTHTHNSIHTSAYTQEEVEEKPDAEETDYSDFLLQAYQSITETDYPQSRGLSAEIIDRFRLGYVADWKLPLEVYLQGGEGRTKEKWEHIPTSPRLIIPTSRYSYLARDTRDQIPAEQNIYKKSKVGKIHFFNRKALYTATAPVFVVEGELDALSIIEVGGEAVALGTTTMWKRFTQLVETAPPAQPLIIALDNDGAGERTARELIDKLQELKITSYRINPAGQHKDANEALQLDREGFRKSVAEALAEVDRLEHAEELARKEEYLKTSTAHYIQSFVDGIADSVNTSYIPTGFEKLDEALDGGLYEGLYIIGAISSLGKTTFILQLVDQIAQAGTDVLIFSLEMARAELISKSISRNTLQLVTATGGDIRNAKTARGITTGSRYIKYSQTERELIQQAIQAYSEYSEHIYISEGVGDIGVAEIRETVKKHILYTGKTPVIVVDYLQILAPYSDRATDKQNTDKAVMELKRISRDYKTPVIGISSFNRDNYTAPVNLTSFKESGAIEYSSDVLFGLQIAGMDYKEGERDGDRLKRIRKLIKDTETQGKNGEAQSLELKVLKNRNGSKGHKIQLSYYPYFNYFKES